ncbi:hypothetical protein EVAR_31118_1 [Eumeta japonica]|uniref:Uncharacterized protein n=1 Tax=Eumeta variegata TaxID=151549 RepID=A0A4C1VFX3_EUMVA|nr:hypothetical protein EVAR_31118_1 [Eumeta japonica]
MMKFKKDLYNMKAWYTPTSSDHKKRFVVHLLLNIRSVYAISIVLKCIWNCCLKDAVMSGCDIKPWIGYDQTPLDHDRAMQLAPDLARREDEHRMWFFSLSPEMQAFALCDLLRISGGPIVWAASRVARDIYYGHRLREIEYIKGNIASIETVFDTTKNTQRKVGAPSYPSDKRMDVNEKKDEENIDSKLDQALKRRDAQLKAWDTLVSAMRKELNLEEISMTFMDGVDRTIWKLNKIDNETAETVDFDANALVALVRLRVFMGGDGHVLVIPDGLLARLRLVIATKKI